MIIRHNLPFRARFFHSLKGIAALLLALLAALIASPEPASAQATPTAPGKPTGVMVTPGDTVLTVSWNAPTNDGGSQITGYIVEHWIPDGDINASEFLPVSSGTTYKMMNLNNWIHYRVRVKAVNDVGTSSPSDTIIKRPLATNAPSAPVLVRVTPGNGVLTAHWTRPMDDGSVGYEGLVYRVDIKSSYEDWGRDRPRLLFLNEKLTVNIPGLENGQAYDVRVFATNSTLEDSPPSNVIQAMPVAPTLVGISVPEATVTSSGATVTVTLDDAIATLVYLRYKKSSDVSWGSTLTSQPQTGSSLSVDFVLSGLVADTAYDAEASLDSSGFTNPQTASFTTLAPLSSDATLSALTLSEVDFGTFASDTETYTAEVVNDPTETTVTPTVNHSGATYVIKIGGVTDSDGTVPLANGDNLITVEVTAEDRATKKTYTVTVTRLVTSEQTEASTDATLSGLILSGVDFGTFASGTETYTADVAYSVSQTTVTPTLNDSDASYVIGFGGTEDTDGTVSLAVGSNVITVEVTAEDDNNREDLYRHRYSRSGIDRRDAQWPDPKRSGLRHVCFRHGDLHRRCGLQRLSDDRDANLE